MQLSDSVFSEDNFRRIIEYAPIGIVIIDRELKWRLVNQRFCEITGYNREELTGKTFLDITYKPDIENNLNLYHQLLDGKIDEYNFEKRYVTKEGVIKWVRLTVSGVRIQGEYSHLIALVQDIGENKRYQTELELKNKELDTLFYKASHDLKAPVTTLEGLWNLLNVENKGLSDSDSFIHLHQTIAKLRSQNETFLQLTKIDQADIAIREVNLESLMRQVAAKANLSWRINRDGTSGMIHSDPDLFLLIIMILVDNVINYAGPLGPSVEITLKKEIKDQIIHFRDHGEGIPEEIQPRVFDMFFKGSDKSRGSGLGLYLAKKAVERLRGTITVSTPEGGGALFTVRLPILQKEFG